MITSIALADFTNVFTTEYCFQYLNEIKYKGGEICCPWCGCVNPYTIKTSRVKGEAVSYKCSDRHCYRKFNAFTGTIFWNTNVPLRLWFFQIFTTAMMKKNISSVQIAKNLGIHQKTSWGMQSKIRSVLTQDKGWVLNGVVEVDEAFASKWPRNDKWSGKISTRKAPILGLIERGGRVILMIVPDRRKATVLPIIRKHVAKGSWIITDGWYGYRDLDQDFDHDYVEHSAREYVRGTIHTNTIENVWSFFKKNIRNAHHAVSIKHLQSYLDECAFKFNNRKLTDMERFNLILKKCCL